MKKINDEINRRIKKLNETALRGKPKRVRDEARGAFHEMQDLRIWISEQPTNPNASKNTFPIQRVSQQRELLKEIFDLTAGAWDDPVISEDLYNRMEAAISFNCA